jgi:hypothetical protein
MGALHGSTILERTEGKWQDFREVVLGSLSGWVADAKGYLSPVYLIFCRFSSENSSEKCDTCGELYQFEARLTLNRYKVNFSPLKYEINL